MHSAILLTFIKLSFVIKIYVLSIFERPFYTGFTVHVFLTLMICYCVNYVRIHHSEVTKRKCLIASQVVKGCLKMVTPVVGVCENVTVSL